jgi:hypothetical protein
MRIPRLQQTRFAKAVKAAARRISATATDDHVIEQIDIHRLRRFA